MVGPRARRTEQRTLAGGRVRLAAVVCGVLAGAGIGGGAMAGLLVFGALDPGPAARAPTVRPIPAWPSAVVVAEPARSGLAPREHERARPRHGAPARRRPHRAAPRVARTARRAVAQPVRAPVTARAPAPTLATAPPPVHSAPVPSRVTPRPARAPRPTATFDDSG